MSQILRGSFTARRLIASRISFRRAAFITLLTVVYACDKQPTGKGNAVPEVANNSSLARVDEQNVASSRIGTETRPTETTGHQVPEWEQKLAKEIRAVASEAQIMDDPVTYRRSVAQLKDALAGHSLEELTAMAEDLRDLAAGSISRYVMLAATVTEMTRRNPGVALTFMEEKLDPSSRGAMAAFAFPELARKDPAILSAWLAKTMGSGKKLGEDLSEGIKALAMVAPEDAFALIDKSAPAESRAHLYSRAFHQLAEADPANALRKLEMIDPRYRSPQVMGHIAHGMAVKSPQAAVDWLQTNKEAHPFALATIFADWLSKDKDAAVAKLKAVPESMLLTVLGDSRTMDRLQRKDPEATLNLLARIVPTRSNSTVILQNLVNLLHHSPDGVATWLDAQTEGGANVAIQRQVFSMWAQMRPAEALAALQKRPALLENERVATGFARGMAGNPLPETMQWSENLPPAQRAHFQQSALGFAAERQPKSVMTYLASHPASATAEIYQTLGSSLAALDATEAKSWSARQTGALGEAAVAGVVAGLAKSDVPGAANWLNQLPPGPNRSAGIKVLVEEIAETDPVAAVEWKNSLK